MIVNKTNSGHYIWGENCEGWRLLDEDNVSVIHEKMPPGTKEKKHYHSKTRQFFFIIKGNVILNIEGQRLHLNENDGIEIKPERKHQIFNESKNDAEFLVISVPAAKNDRTDLE